MAHPVGINNSLSQTGVVHDLLPPRYLWHYARGEEMVRITSLPRGTHYHCPEQDCWYFINEVNTVGTPFNYYDSDSRTFFHIDTFYHILHPFVPTAHELENISFRPATRLYHIDIIEDLHATPPPLPAPGATNQTSNMSRAAHLKEKSSEIPAPADSAHPRTLPPSSLIHKPRVKRCISIDANGKRMSEQIRRSSDLGLLRLPNMQTQVPAYTSNPRNAISSSGSRQQWSSLTGISRSDGGEGGPSQLSSNASNSSNNQQPTMQAQSASFQSSFHNTMALTTYQQTSRAQAQLPPMSGYPPRPLNAISSSSHYQNPTTQLQRTPSQVSLNAKAALNRYQQSRNQAQVPRSSFQVDNDASPSDQSLQSRMPNQIAPKPAVSLSPLDGMIMSDDRQNPRIQTQRPPALAPPQFTVNAESNYYHKLANQVPPPKPAQPSVTVASQPLAKPAPPQTTSAPSASSQPSSSSTSPRPSIQSTPRSAHETTAPATKPDWKALLLAAGSKRKIYDTLCHISITEEHLSAIRENYDLLPEKCFKDAPNRQTKKNTYITWEERARYDQILAAKGEGKRLTSGGRLTDEEKRIGTMFLKAKREADLAHLREQMALADAAWRPSGAGMSDEGMSDRIVGRALKGVVGDSEA